MIDELNKQSAVGAGDIVGHKALIAGIVLAMGKTTIVETGVREGNSTDALLKAAVLNGSKVVSVDLNATPYAPPTPQMRSAWTFLQGDARRWLGNLASTVAGQCGVIMLDDWHSAEHVAAELELCKPLLASNHVVVIHDSMWANTQPHYNKAMCSAGDEFEGGGPWGAISLLNREQWEYMTVPAHNGLTLLRYLW